MQDFIVSLSANTEKQIDVSGDYFQVIEAASPVELLFDQQGNFVKRRQGQGSGADRYELVTVRSAVAQTVRLSLGFAGNAAPVNGAAEVSGSVAAQFEAPNQAAARPVVTIPAESSAVIVGANAARLSLRLSLASDAPGAVLLAGPGEAQAGYGGLLEPGMTDYLPNAGAVEAYNGNAEPVTVYALELSRI